MSKRRPDGAGSFTRLDSGRWQCRMSVTDPDTGESTRFKRSGETKKAAQEATAAAVDEWRGGLRGTSKVSTVAEITRVWRETILIAYPAGTRLSYESRARLHIEPSELGTVRLTALKPSHVARFMASAQGSPSSRRTTLTVLRHVLDQAVSDKLLTENPARMVPRPQLLPVERETLVPGEVVALLAATAHTRYHPALVVAAETGARVGEVLALRSRDIDREAMTLSIAGTLTGCGTRLARQSYTKGKRPRPIPLSVPALAALDTVMKRQKVERLALGPSWPGLGVVFTGERGQYVDSRTILRSVRRAVEREAIGHGHATTHTLRHATLDGMMKAGVPVRDVAEIAGHSSTAITVQHYGHSADESRRAALMDWSARLAGG